jgi:hypothetical protein
MTKAKDTIKEFREKLFEAKKKEVVEEATKVVESLLENETYSIIQDPSAKNRSFIMIKIKFNVETGEAQIVGKCPFPDKAAGLTIQRQLANNKYLFEKNNRSKK